MFGNSEAALHNRNKIVPHIFDKTYCNIITVTI